MAGLEVVGAESDAPMVRGGDPLELLIESCVFLRSWVWAPTEAAPSIRARELSRHMALVQPEREGMETGLPAPARMGAVLLLCVFKRERRRVDAVTQAGGVGAVGKHMTKMTAAAGAGDFNAAHAVAQVFMLIDGF